jgi:carboxylesterase type B
MPTLQDEQQRGADLMAAMDVGSLQDLRKTDAAALLTTYTELAADHYHSPAIDDQLVTESLWKNMRSGPWPDHAILIGTNAGESTDKTVTAQSYTCPSQSVAARRSASGGKAWMYFFSRVREDEAGTKLGAYHGAEYPYVFGVHDAYMTTAAIDRDLSTQMQKYWINFATTGNPNGAGLPNWPMFERPEPLVQEFGDVITTIPATDPEMCASFEASN